ncbi:MAG TPA: hypothetical protein VFZ67_08815 [Nitrososphaera sp.]
MTNLKNVLSVGLAAATLAAVFPFFAGFFSIVIAFAPGPKPEKILFCIK